MGTKTSKQLLEDFKIFDLDEFEYFQYTNHLIKVLPNKVEALQILINNVERDYTQLSKKLARIAKLQDKENKK